MKDNRIYPKKNPDLKCDRHHDQAPALRHIPLKTRLETEGTTQHTPSGRHAIAYSRWNAGGSGRTVSIFSHQQSDNSTFARDARREKFTRYLDNLWPAGETSMPRANEIKKKKVWY